MSVPKKTLSLREMERQAKRAQAAKVTPMPTSHWRPKTRLDCFKVPRPCPYVTCRYNLFLEVCQNGSLRLPHGEHEDAVLKQKRSCALDLAEDGPRTLDDVGRAQSLNRERVRQIEAIAVAKVRALIGYPVNLADGGVSADVPVAEEGGEIEQHEWSKTLLGR